MPWFDLAHRRKRPEDVALADVWSSLRTLREHAAGIFNIVSTIAVTVARHDARLESLGADLADLRRSMLKVPPPDGKP